MLSFVSIKTTTFKVNLTLRRSQFYAQTKSFLTLRYMTHLPSDEVNVFPQKKVIFTPLMKYFLT